MIFVTPVRCTKRRKPTQSNPSSRERSEANWMGLRRRRFLDLRGARSEQGQWMQTPISLPNGLRPLARDSNWPRRRASGDASLLRHCSALRDRISDLRRRAASPRDKIGAALGACLPCYRPSQGVRNYLHSKWLEAGVYGMVCDQRFCSLKI